LALAVGFAALLNVMLAASLVWTGWMSPTVQVAGWIALAAIWLISAIAAATAGRGSAERPGAETAELETSPAEVLFREAIAQYLQGNWFETETALRRILKDSQRDVEARLMLATLLRHTGRLEEAAEQLQQTSRLEVAAHWREEMQNEWRLLSEAQLGEPAPSESESDEPAAGEISRAA
jgi:tetratricopeptide (TPR) repeat protein